MRHAACVCCVHFSDACEERQVRSVGVDYVLGVTVVRDMGITYNCSVLLQQTISTFVYDQYPF